jgi:alanine dehydrogenase
MTIHLSNDHIKQVLDMSVTMEALQVGYADLRKGDATHIPRIDLYVPTGREEDFYRWGSMSGACRTYKVVAVRMKSDILSWSSNNAEQKYAGRPGLFSGVIILYSIETGEPLALINDGYLQHMRVGGSAGICTDVLSKKDATRVAVLGSGGMARVYLEAVSLIRDLSHVSVFSPTPENRVAFAEEMSSKLQLPVEPAESAEAAVRDADIVLSASNSMVATFDSAWLSPGMHVVTVNPREVDQSTLDRADLVVQLGRGTIPSSIAIPGVTYGVGGFASYVAGQPEERQRIPRSEVWERQHDYPALFDYDPRATPGRESDDQITLCLNWGTQGLQFASVAGLAYQRAIEAGLGNPLPDDLFLQDIRN